jgi:hypothetical protein
MQNISRNHTFVTDISSSTGRNDLIWLWHGDLYRVSPFQVYRTVRLRIFHVCRNENFRYRYLSFYWKKWIYIWYMAFAWWIVPCLPFPGLPCVLEFFMFAVMKTFVTDISASTGRNDFIFDLWLLHGELYRVYPFQVYRTSISCLPCDLDFCNRYLSFYWKKWFYIWYVYMAFAWWLVPCLPFPGLPHIYFRYIQIWHKWTSGGILSTT